MEVITLEGLKRYLVLFVIELKTRYIHFVGIHPVPDGAWMEQMARNLTDPDAGFLRASHHLIHDRDPLYTKVCEEILRRGGVHPVRLPARSPNLNAYASLAAAPPPTSDHSGSPVVGTLSRKQLLMTHSITHHEHLKVEHLEAKVRPVSERFLTQPTPHRGRLYSELSGGLPGGETHSPLDSLLGQLESWPPERLALRFRPLQPCLHPLGDPGPLKFGNSCQNVHLQCSRWRRGIDAFLEGDKRHAKHAEFVEQRDQMPEIAA